MRSLPMRESPKRETLRSRRRRMRVIGGLAIATCAVLAAYAASFVSYLPQFSIVRVEIEGARALRSKLVEAFVATKLWDGTPQLFSESNVFLYPRAEIESALADFFPRIESATLSRESLLSGVVVVTLKERTPYARWCSSDGPCFAMDTGGVIFESATTTDAFETHYIFEGSFAAGEDPRAKKYLPGQFAAVLALLERLGQAGYAAERVSVEEGQDFAIFLAEGFSLRVSFGTDVATVAKNLELVLASEALRGKERVLDYVDLRFGNRVYYKLKGGEESSL